MWIATKITPTPNRIFQSWINFFRDCDEAFFRFFFSFSPLLFLMYYCIVDHDFFLWTKIIIRAHNHHLLRTIDIFSKYIFLTIFPFFLFFLKISIIEFYACQKCNNFLVLPFLKKNCRIVKITQL